MGFIETLGVSESVSMQTFSTGASLIQNNIQMIPGNSYRLSFVASNVLASSTLNVFQGTQQIAALSPAATGTNTINFIADTSGQNVSFAPTSPSNATSVIKIDNVSLREVVRPSVSDDRPVKEFLSGTSDDGEEIFFRADTQEIQLMDQFELFANPVAIITKGQRGSSTRCFISLDGGEFYELQGTIKKGMTILKVNAPNTPEIDPAMTRKIKISWRDSSKQLCRITQGAIIFQPTTADEVE